MLLILSQGVVEHQTENSKHLQYLMDKVDNVLTECCGKDVPTNVGQCTEQLKVDADVLEKIRQEVKETLVEVMAEKMKGFQAVKTLHDDVVKQVVKSFREHIAEHQSQYDGRIDDYKKQIRAEIENFSSTLQLHRNQLKSAMTQPLVKAEGHAAQLAGLVGSFQDILRRLQELTPNIELANGALQSIKDYTSQLNQSVASVLSDRESLIDSVQQKLDTVLDEIGRVGTGSGAAIATAQQKFVVQSELIQDRISGAISTVRGFAEELDAQRQAINGVSQQTAITVQKTSEASQRILDELDAQRQAINGVSQQTAITVQKTSEASQRILDEQEKLNSSINKVDSLIQRAKETQTQSDNRLSRSVNQLGNDLKSQQGLVAALQQRIDTANELQERLDNIQTRVETKVDAILQSRHEVSNTQPASQFAQQINELAGAIQQLRNEIATKSSSRADLMVDEAQIQSNLHLLYQGIGRDLEIYARKQVEDFASAISKINMGYSKQWQDNAANVSNLIDQRQGQLDWLQQQIEKQTEQLRKQSLELDEHFITVQNEQSRALDLIQRNNAKQDLIYEATEQFDKLKHKIQTTSQSIVVLDGQLQQKRDQLLTLDKQLDNSKKQVNNAIGVIDASIDEKIKLQSINNKMANEAQHQLQKSKIELSQTQAKLLEVTTELGDKDVELQKAIYELNSVKQAAQQEDNKRQSLENEIQSLKKKKNLILHELDMGKKIEDIESRYKLSLSKLTKRAEKETSKVGNKRPHLQISESVDKPNLKSQYQSSHSIQEQPKQLNHRQANSSIKQTEIDFHPPPQDDQYIDQYDEENKMDGFGRQNDGIISDKRQDDVGQDYELLHDLSLIVEDATGGESGGVNWWAVGLGVFGVGIAGGIIVHKWRKKKRSQHYNL